MTFMQSSVFGNKSDKKVLEYYQALANGETTLLTLTYREVTQSADKEKGSQISLTPQLEDIILKVHNKITSMYACEVLVFTAHSGLSETEASINWTAKSLTAALPLVSIRLNTSSERMDTINILTEGSIAIVDLNDSETVEYTLVNLSNTVQLYEDYSAIVSTLPGVLSKGYENMEIISYSGTFNLANDENVLNETNCEYPQAVTVVDTLMHDKVSPAMYKSGKLYIAILHYPDSFENNVVVETDNLYGNMYFDAPQDGYVNLITNEGNSYLISFIDGSICGIFPQEVNTLINNSKEFYLQDSIMNKVYQTTLTAANDRTKELEVEWITHNGEEVPVPATSNFAVALRFVSNTKQLYEGIYLTGASLLNPTNANSLTPSSHVIMPALYVTQKGKNSINLVDDCFMELTDNGELDLRSIINWITVSDELIKLNSTDNTYKLPTTTNTFWEHALTQLCLNMRLGQVVQIDKVNVTRIELFELKFTK